MLTSDMLRHNDLFVQATIYFLQSMEKNSEVESGNVMFKTANSGCNYYKTIIIYIILLRCLVSGAKKN